ncbi:hypothetical protein SODALDRAFT_355648 [Sodiomyces alkalinus F11]|uniref:Uncharacterized protein n=1 Tax=Sodiomyces alkalinus (strain CBS 110278 / VKM F-3762 / F11) TaxID=1314773 RepID=A0A3N2Q9K9_SODAK|nr:hypothetical protein SODALDRAFT_355648 [Sodiomyces alkalinus F11]ROT43441.1 hypothetical protein SODALDRAFT_355648 [Sodiomyces alkalinus F11]
MSSVLELLKYLAGPIKQRGKETKLKTSYMQNTKEQMVADPPYRRTMSLESEKRKGEGLENSSSVFKKQKQG